MSTDLDVALFGATGFVGRLTAVHLAEHAPPGTRVALVGRNRHRLAALRRQLPHAAAEWEIVLADASEPPTLAAVAARARVVATTVGPYVRLGMPLLEACALAGTHYCDLTGEVLFVRASSDLWHRTAIESGARIVHSCGFDSVPSDLGVLLTADTVDEDDEGDLTRTVLAVRSMRGGFSGGTIDSMRQQAMAMRADPVARAIVADPYALSPDRGAEPAAPPAEGTHSGPIGTVRTVAAGLGRRLPVRRDEVTGRWTAPFVMAAYNTRVVRRSNALQDWRYGRSFRYREVVDFGRGARGPVLATASAAGVLGLVAGLSFEPTRMVLDRMLPKPGEGPGEDERARGRFRMVIDTLTTSGATYRTRIGDERDPGYGSTAVMLGESALALALDEDRLPAAAGVLTPATGIGQVLVERLRDQGFTLDCDRGTPLV